MIHIFMFLLVSMFWMSRLVCQCLCQHKTSFTIQLSADMSDMTTSHVTRIQYEGCDLFLSISFPIEMIRCRFDFSQNVSKSRMPPLPLPGIKCTSIHFKDHDLTNHFILISFIQYLYRSSPFYCHFCRSVNLDIEESGD